MAAQSPQQPYWPYTAERRRERRGSSAPLSAASAGRSDGGRSRDAQLSDDRRPDGGGVGVADGVTRSTPSFLRSKLGEMRRSKPAIVSSSPRDGRSATL